MHILQLFLLDVILNINVISLAYPTKNKYRWLRKPSLQKQRDLHRLSEWIQLKPGFTGIWTQFQTMANLYVKVYFCALEL